MSQQPRERTNTKSNKKKVTRKSAKDKVENEGIDVVDVVDGLMLKL